MLAGLAAITLIALHSQARHLFSVPDRGDPLFSMWRIAWVQHQLVADPRHLFDANIFYPLRASLTYSDAMIAPAISAWPLAWIGLHPVIGYNVLLLVSFVLSGWATYALVRSLEGGAMAAWIAAVAFMLTPFRMNHLSHLELQMTMWMPIAVAAVLRLLQTGERKYIAGTAVALAGQWYSSMYYGLFLTLYAAVFAAVLIVARKAAPRRAVLLLASCAIAGVLLLPLAWTYARSQPARGVRGLDTIAEFSATPADYTRPGVATPAYRRVLPRVVHAERALFPGVVPLVLLVAGLWPPWSGPRAAISVAGLLAFDGSLGLHGILYPILYRIAFPFHSIRVPSRFGMLVMLSIAVVAGYGGSRLVSRVRNRTARYASLVLITAGLMVDGWPRFDTLPMWDGPPSVYASLPPQAVLFEYPVHPQPERFAENLPYMYFSIWHWRPMVNGYSGFNPRGYAATLEGTRSFPAAGALEYLRGAGVTHVTVHCRFWEPAVCESTLKALDGERRVRLIARAEWYGAPSSLYEIRR